MKTLAEAKQLNKDTGHYFFDRKTLKFWNSKTHGKLYKEKYFITSEDNYNRSKRLYSIRAINWENGDIDTVGAFQQYQTLEDAKEAFKGGL